ncbi:hypothetical protein GCM10027091_06870 [Streptomyces daliensis]
MGDLTAGQRKLGYALLGSALSADGLTLTRNIMKLNAFLGDYSGGNKETLTEGHYFFYFFTFMGSEPTSATYQVEKGNKGGGGPGGMAGPGGDSTRQHIHTIIRTPNGNDYGVDLLKLHLDNDH